MRQERQEYSNTEICFREILSKSLKTLLVFIYPPKLRGRIGPFFEVTIIPLQRRDVRGGTLGETYCLSVHSLIHYLGFRTLPSAQRGTCYDKVMS